MIEETAELFREDAYLREADAVVVAAGVEGVVLDRTPFYAAAGGQPGDIGSLINSDGVAATITDTIYDANRHLRHLPADTNALPEVGTRVRAVLDWPRRHRLMRVHSCMHLLCQAVGEPVTGCQVAADKGRMDFALSGDVPAKETLTERINAWIAADHAIRHFWIEAAELDERPDLVRTMLVRPPRTGGRVRLVEIEGIDLQACGGTHVARTSEIGAVEVVKSESKGKQNRRFTVELRDA